MADIAGVYAETGITEQSLQLLSQALQTARTLEEAGEKSMAFYDIALTYAKAGDFGQALETAKMMEDAVLKSEVLVEISGDVARLSEEDTTILLEITHTIRPLSQLLK